MSRKGDCWDNAVVESFFETLKRELVDGCVYRSHEEARQAIFEYVEVYYNRKRRHSSLGYLTPMRLSAKLSLLNYGNGFSGTKQRDTQPTREIISSFTEAEHNPPSL